MYRVATKFLELWCVDESVKQTLLLSSKSNQGNGTLPSILSSMGRLLVQFSVFKSRSDNKSNIIEKYLMNSMPSVQHLIMNFKPFIIRTMA